MGIRKRIITYIPIGIILIISLFFRFFWLDRIPNAIGGDELTYLISAKSIVQTGKDLTGTWNPLSAFIFKYPPNEQQAELPYFIHLPFSGLLSFSLFTARFPIAILSVGIVILLYGIARKIFDTKTAVVVGLIAAINPWMVYIGRTSYEWSIAVFFYLLGLYLVIQKQKSLILLSGLAFLLGFYSYIGTKIILIPFVLISIFLAYRLNGKRYQKQYAVIGIISVLFTLFFLMQVTRTTTGSRVSELFLPTNSTIASEVDYFRKNSISSWLTQVYTNKMTVYIQILVTKLYRIFSPTYLFLEGDEFFSLWNHGMFYAIDALFLIIGSLYLFSKKRVEFILITLFILVATLPQLFHKNKTDFSYHIAFMFPFMVLLISYGITQLVQSMHKSWKKIVMTAICCLYLISIGKFISVYVYQHPLRGYFDFHARVLSQYLLTARKLSIPITLYSDANSDYFRKFLFYTNSISLSTIKEITSDFSTPTFTLGGITFAPCDDRLVISPSSTISIVDRNCSSIIDVPHLSISRLSDGGELYRIYNDSLCNGFNLKRYSQNISIHDFAMDGLSQQRFCETYISRL
ncbi:MAG: glycosyltransferase family 39 protein [Candidatus Gottesmanbacteria bacterium]